MQIFYKRAQIKYTPSNKSFINSIYKRYQFRVENTNSIIVYPFSNIKFLIKSSYKHLQIVELLEFKKCFSKETLAL